MRGFPGNPLNVPGTFCDITGNSLNDSGAGILDCGPIDATDCICVYMCIYTEDDWSGINPFILKKAEKFLHMVTLSPARKQHRY